MDTWYFKDVYNPKEDAVMKNQNLSDEIYTLLKNQILNGTLVGGEKIPEESLA